MFATSTASAKPSPITLSRRTVLRGAGGLAVVAALAPSFAQAAAAAPGLTGADLEVLRARWVDSLTGRNLISGSPSTFADAIATLDQGVTARLAMVSPSDTQFFSDHNWGGPQGTAQSNAMRLNYVDLQTMAVAWATPGSAHEGSAAVLDTVKAGLEHLHTTIYNENTDWWGNWWSWIIGASRPLADIMAILHAELDQSAIDTYCASIDHFLPNRDPRLQIHPSGVISSDGANRVDICQAIIVRSIVQPDTALLQAAVSALSPTWQYVTEGNGFFKDGSFVQHSTIGYTGTYGLVLLGGLSKLFALLAGTTFDITDPTRANLTSAVEGSFAPLMYNGQMMDAVRGRAVSRFAERSIDDGNQLIEYTLRLAQAADAATARHWRGLCKQWIVNNAAATVTDTTNIVRLALVTDLMSSSVPARADETGPRLFQAMDRLVYRGKRSSWALCVAMCSRRIAWHEGTPAENFEGVKTSQGMTYLYLAGDDDHFDDDYWATFDLTAPPGTTVDLTPLPPNPEGEWGATTPQNEWTGGVTFDDLALAGMHLVAPGGTGLVARKSWFTLPDMVVALGSDISTQSDAEVRTVVEHRNLGDRPRELLVSLGATDRTVRADATKSAASEIAGGSAVGGARWAHLEGAGGYVFLDGAPGLTASVAPREGTWQRNNTSTAAGAGDLRTRQYATLAYSHGSGADVAGSTYAYVVLPGAGVARTKAQARRATVTVLRNDATAQGLGCRGGLTAANFWRPGTVGDFTANGSLCLIARKTGSMARISVSDPTQAQSTVTLVVTNTRARRVRGVDASRVTLVRSGNVVTLTIDVSASAGRTLEFALHT
ncbi:hypothetical protein BA895_20100 [Humibacillus sp. DSM 29435]|uniref:polysaccharide lyase 8 family protein n=1 Tax=Humibacillus sp. DSM 29435 TaxID=1869167 RepID=UPI0008728078|nr:polysaccharide lyase 8 family protein [Humibacillus sp. DSM 29435]OFE16190.1 hypothetical protein BA895_20100 [Humibacillus sp. DSM 29435]